MATPPGKDSGYIPPMDEVSRGLQISGVFAVAERIATAVWGRLKHRTKREQARHRGLAGRRMRACLANYPFVSHELQRTLLDAVRGTPQGPAWSAMLRTWPGDVACKRLSTRGIPSHLTADEFYSVRDDFRAAMEGLVQLHEATATVLGLAPPEALATERARMQAIDGSYKVLRKQAEGIAGQARP